jgi:hypothetical protein
MQYRHHKAGTGGTELPDASKLKDASGFRAPLFAICNIVERRSQAMMVPECVYAAVRQGRP